ncbi:phage tail protein [uncultured Planococcus sp.]|uniref:phage tail protein n=1 Tax=uncultured Planococcus sp. TaxID=337815 RepID=UPI002617B509|nr:phage tail protein [uncultured Planococcus sp.]
MATNKLNLPTITHNQTADVPRDMNALANAIDAQAGAANGLSTLGTDGKVPPAQLNLTGKVDKTALGAAGGVATLGTDGKVPATQIAVDLTAIESAATAHAATAATGTRLGHVTLSSATDSNDSMKAATPLAVKRAYDRADAAFTSASNGKAVVKQAVTGVDPRVVMPTDPTFSQLATAVGQIETGKRWAKGNVGTSSANDLTVAGLNFKPRLILVGVIGQEAQGLAHTFWSNDLDPTRGYLGGTSEAYTLSSLGHYVESGGFKLKRSQASLFPAFWIAYE